MHSTQQKAESEIFQIKLYNKYVCVWIMKFPEEEAEAVQS